MAKLTAGAAAVKYTVLPLTITGIGTGLGMATYHYVLPSIRDGLKEAASDLRNDEGLALPYDPAHPGFLLAPIAVSTDGSETIIPNPLEQPANTQWKTEDGKMVFAHLPADGKNLNYGTGKDGITTFSLEGWTQEKFFAEANVRKTLVIAKQEGIKSNGVLKNGVRAVENFRGVFNPSSGASTSPRADSGTIPLLGRIGLVGGGLATAAVMNFTPVSLLLGGAMAAFGLFSDTILGLFKPTPAVQEPPAKSDEAKDEKKEGPAKLLERSGVDTQDRSTSAGASRTAEPITTDLEKIKLALAKDVPQDQAARVQGDNSRLPKLPEPESRKTV